MQEDSARTQDTEASDRESTKIPIAVMSDIKPAEPVAPESPVTEMTNEGTMATPPEDDVMPDLASEAAPAPEAAPEHEAPAAPSPTDAIKKKSGLGLVIAIVAVVVVALAAAGYFALANKDTAAPKASTQVGTDSTATKADPVADSTAIDDSLSSLDQNKDFSSTELSDTTLGL